MFLLRNNMVRSGLLVVLLLITGTVVWILALQGTSSVRRRADDQVCNAKLKQLGNALGNYRDCFGCLPPAYLTDETGRPLHSWRVLLLPFVEAQDLYLEYEWREPWNGPTNSKLGQKLHRRSGGHLYQCPSANASGSDSVNYVAVIGPQTVWPDGIPYADAPPPSSVLLVELPESHIHWMEPRDITVAELGSLPSPFASGFPHNGHFNYLVASGRVAHLRGEADLNFMQSFKLIAPVPEKEHAHIQAARVKLLTRLLECLNDDRAIVRHGAVLLLGQLDDAAITIVQSLPPLLGDDHPGVRAAAEFTLRKLRAKEK